MSHLFVSYSQPDQAYARALAADLRAHSFDVWIDNRIDHGDAWWKTLASAIADCAVLVVVMSPAAEESAWVAREIELARAADRPILPLLLEGTPFPALLTLEPEDVRGARMPGAGFYERVMQHVHPRSQPGRTITPPPPSTLTRPLPPDRRRFAVRAHDRRWLAVALALALGLVALLTLLVLLNTP